MTLTVKELIEKLEKMPQDANVEIEGCDCVGSAEDVELSSESSNDWVIILR